MFLSYKPPELVQRCISFSFFENQKLQSRRSRRIHQIYPSELDTWCWSPKRSFRLAGYVATVFCLMVDEMGRDSLGLGI